MCIHTHTHTHKRINIGMSVRVWCMIYSSYQSVSALRGLLTIKTFESKVEYKFSRGKKRKTNRRSNLEVTLKCPWWLAEGLFLTTRTYTTQHPLPHLLWKHWELSSQAIDVGACAAVIFLFFLWDEYLGRPSLVFFSAWASTCRLLL